jgi:hypothetical protein
MHDWQQIAREGMESCSLPTEYRDEVLTELATHLEETYTEACVRGRSHEEAVALALREVEDWKVLRETICRAKSGEGPMNQRTKRFLMPAISALFAAGLVLLLLDRAPVLQRLIWIAEMGMLLWVAASEMNHFSQRTKRFWLPGLSTMIAASLLLFVADIVYDWSRFFTQMGLRPQYLLQADSAPGRIFYGWWLLANFLCGALGAFLSRRAGGTRTTRVVTGAMPAMTMFGLCAVVVPITFLITRQAAPSLHPADVGWALCVWVVAPAIALLLGSAPFLRNLELQEAKL